MPAMQKKKVPNQVRIIGGDWKRTPLPVLEALGLRPTPDRVRETWCASRHRSRKPTRKSAWMAGSRI